MADKKKLKLKKLDVDTGYGDRPWPEGSCVMMVEDDDDPCIAQILCYLHEEDCVAPTEVVYRVVFGSPLGKCFNEEVQRILEHGWVKDVSVQRGFF